MPGTFHVELVTPQRTVFSGEVTAVTVPGVEGPFQVLVNHAPIVSALEVGDIRILDTSNHEMHFATAGGFAEMRKNSMTIIADSAEPVDDIDMPRAERARDRAEQRIREGRADRHAGIDMMRAEAALARAINRIKVSSPRR
jgi:F-type H+-transporting ATPase subunit epsilon